MTPRPLPATYGGIDFPSCGILQRPDPQTHTPPGQICRAKPQRCLLCPRAGQAGTGHGAQAPTWAGRGPKVPPCHQAAMVGEGRGTHAGGRAGGGVQVAASPVAAEALGAGLGPAGCATARPLACGTGAGVTRGHQSVPTRLRGRHWSKCTAPSSPLPRCDAFLPLFFFFLPFLGPRSQSTSQDAITHPPRQLGRNRYSCPRCWCRCRSPDTPSPARTRRYLRGQRCMAPGKALWHPIPPQSQPSSPEQCLPSPVRPGGQGSQPASGSQPTPGKHPWAQGSGGCWQKGPE